MFIYRYMHIVYIYMRSTGSLIWPARNCATKMKSVVGHSAEERERDRERVRERMRDREREREREKERGGNGRRWTVICWGIVTTTIPLHFWNQTCDLRWAEVEWSVCGGQGTGGRGMDRRTDGRRRIVRQIPQG